MRLRLPGGREIPAVNPQKATALHLIELRTQTRKFTEDGQGLGMRALSAMRRDMRKYELLRRAAKKAGKDPDLIDPPDEIDLWMTIAVFLSRRAAGDKLTFEDAADFGIDDIHAIPEPGDENIEEDAGSPPGSSLAGPETSGASPGGTSPETTLNGPSTMSPNPSTDGSPPSATSGQESPPSTYSI